jgi:hypothetical protein
MGYTTHPMSATKQRRMTWLLLLVAGLLGALAFSVTIAVSATPATETGSDVSLPNPMGGEAVPAPGDASGQVSFAGLEIADAEVSMGDVALGVTYVPGWEVSNPTDRELSFTAGQPQVVEGCCPGPVYADGELTQASQQFTVPPDGSVLLQFPLQMHPGMDGPHHLAIPLLAGSEEAAVHVTGNFTATAPAA